MAIEIIGEIKRDYVAKLAKDGKRVDGRRFDEYRPIQIETGFISQAEGSARVRIGDTHIVSGVKVQAGAPFPDTPDSGVLTTNAELVPIASPAFETGPPRPESIELARVVDRGIRETETIDVTKLCIKAGEKVWVVYVDLHVLDYDGNLFDAASLAGLAALMTAKVPAKKFDLGEDYPLPVDHAPISCTALKLAPGRIVFDAGLIEDAVGGPRLTVSTDENGLIRAMQKGRVGGFTRDEVKHIIAIARARGEDIRKQLLPVVGRKF